MPRLLIRKRLAAAYLDVLVRRRRMTALSSGARLPDRTPVPVEEQWLSRLLERPHDFHDEFRMSIPCFWKLHHVLRTYYGLTSPGNMPSYEALGMLLSLCGHSTTQRRLGRLYSHSTGTVNISYRETLNAICKMAVDIIEPDDRSFAALPSKILRKAPEFISAIGALDGTHIPAMVSEEVKSDYIGRKGSPTQNVLVVVDFNMMFTHVFAGVPGSQHDAAILRYAWGTESATFPHPPEGNNQ